MAASRGYDLPPLTRLQLPTLKEGFCDSIRHTRRTLYELVRRTGVRWTSSRHGLSEDKLSSFFTDFRKVRTEHDSTDNANRASHRNRERSAHLIRNDARQQSAKRRHPEKHHRIERHDPASQAIGHHALDQRI